MITFQKYVRATSLEEAYELNQKRQNLVVGGMLWVRMGKGNFQTVIDLCDLELNHIEETDEEFSIGAMVTLRQLELHEGLNDYTNHTVQKAVQDIVGVQFRNLATIGGSIYGRFGFSDLLTVFQSYEAYVELYKGGMISLEEYAASKPDRDILVRIIVKKKPARFAYQAMRIARTDFPVLTCATSFMNGEYKVVIGARPGKAMVFRDDDNVLKEKSNRLTQDSILRFSETIAEKTPTDSNVRGSASYRKQLVRVLTQRALMEMENRAQ